MKNSKLALIGLFGLIAVSCNKDDEGDDFVEVPVRDRAEQQVTDNDSIIGYLETHYYNSDAINALNAIKRSNNPNAWLLVKDLN